MITALCDAFGWWAMILRLVYILSIMWYAASVFAEKAAAMQLSAFRRWGVMADWQTGCYYSYDKQYEVNQLEVFYKMYEKVWISVNCENWQSFACYLMTTLARFLIDTGNFDV